MKKIIITALCSLVVLVAIDSTWLTIASKRFYAPQLGSLLAKNIQIVPIVLFYVLYAFGITIFVILPALQGSFSLMRLFSLGAFLGLISYGAYDFTNQATLQNWPMIVTVVDLLWGCILTGTTSVIAAQVARYFLQ